MRPISILLFAEWCLFVINGLGLTEQINKKVAIRGYIKKTEIEWQRNGKICLLIFAFAYLSK